MDISYSVLLKDINRLLVDIVVLLATDKMTHQQIIQ
jgi:hypothetical protein